MDEFGGSDFQYEPSDTVDTPSEYGDASSLGDASDVPTDFPEDEPEQIQFGNDWTESQGEILDGGIKGYQRDHPELLKFNFNARNGLDDVGDDFSATEAYGETFGENVDESEIAGDFPEDIETAEYNDAGAESTALDALDEDCESAEINDSSEPELTLEEDTAVESPSADEFSEDASQIYEWDEDETVDIEHDDMGANESAYDVTGAPNDGIDEIDDRAPEAGGHDSADFETKFEKEMTNQPETVGEMPPNMPVDTAGWDELQDVPFAGEETGTEYSEPADSLSAGAVDAETVTDVPNQSIDDVGGWLSDVNPQFDPWDVDSPYSSNCGSCALAVENRLNGNSDAVATDSTLSIEEMEQQTGMEQVSMQPDEIEQYLISQGPGSHAIIGIDRSEGPGHWFNAYYDGEKVYALDGQTGTTEGWPPDYGDVVNWDVSVKKGE